MKLVKIFVFALVVVGMTAPFSVSLIAQDKEEKVETPPPPPPVDDPDEEEIIAAEPALI